MQCSEEADSPPTQRRSRTSNACVQCQRKKKRCDGGMPQCTSCTERQLQCTYLGVRRRGRGKAKVYLEKLEAIVGEFETSLRGNSTSDPVESANNNTSSVETHADEAQSSSSLPDVLPLFGPGAKNPPELHPGSVDHDKVQSAVRERLFTTLHEQISPEKPWMAPKKGPFTSSIFIQLPPKPYLQLLFEVTFVEPYPMVPVFDLHVLLRLLDQHYSHSPTFSLENYPQRWAMLNTAVAIGIQLRAAKGSEAEMVARSWPFFKNAFGMYVPITLRGVDILALEALLAMFAYMQGSSDLRTTSVLVSSAARFALTLGLHRETYYSGLDLGAANRARRAFWTCFVLDRDMSTRTGMLSNFDEEAISVDHLDLIQAEPAASSAETSHSARPRTNNDMSSSAASILFLQSRVKLAILRSTVDKLLFSKYASEQSVPELLSIVAELEHQLINWKAHLPSTLRPDHINPPTTTMGRQPILLMHMAYYSTLSKIHGFAAHLGSKGNSSSSVMWQVNTARIAQVSAAAEIIRLLQFVSREEQPGHLWNLLLYPVAACIMLVSIVLESPTDTQACSCAQHIGDIVAFLRGLQHDRVLDVQGLLDLCGAFETLVREAISGAVDGTASSGPLHNGINPGLDTRRQHILSYTHGRTSSLQLASGLMDNIPALCSIAAGTFSDLVPKIQISPISSQLAPSSLRPETYGFTFA
ncbi:hypothetical protein BJX68DRAFT_279076 [Aspergillus pseudodeflectus]|uniref:Zn(2)-C6 fungal-type domain-containing protein n=1 Tax=Aspergillus pseudodeflectus TaxID=176178 RepID=A0ABR4JJT2_9EURO